MHKLSKVFVPTISQRSEGFSFYKEGICFYKNSYRMQDDFEDSLRRQLEQADLFEGLFLTADKNCGFGSFVTPIMQYFEDEVPKAPKMMFSIKNHLDDNPLTKDLVQLNQSLALSFLLDSC